MLSTNKLIKPLLILILIGLAVYFAPIVIFKERSVLHSMQSSMIWKILASASVMRSLILTYLQVIFDCIMLDLTLHSLEILPFMAIPGGLSYED